MLWRRPKISHAVRNLAKVMGQDNKEAIKAMHRLMDNCVDTPNRGVTLRPEGSWDHTKDYKFVISSRPDSDYVKDPDTRTLVSGTRISVNGASTHW